MRFKSLLATCILAFAAGCGTAPSVRDASLLVKGRAKAEQINFVYRQVAMKTVSTRRYGQGASISYTGFDEFGKLLVELAGDVFAGRQVTVLSSSLLDGAAPMPAGATPVPILLVQPVSGESSATRHASRTSYVFSAQLLDPASRRLLWKATVDTSTWVGKDLVSKNFETTNYDAAYARQLLATLAEKMAADGLVP
jgi:hypothetical protein